MRSRVDRPAGGRGPGSTDGPVTEPLWFRLRVAGEWALRAVVLGLLLWCLVLVVRARTEERVEVGTSATLRESLVRWTTVSRPSRVHVVLDHPPSRAEQEWLVALSGAGTAVEWTGDSLVPTAMAVEPRADPAGGVDVSVAAPPGAVVALRDTLGELGAVEVPANGGAAGVRVHLAKPRPRLDAAVGPIVAQASPFDSLHLKRLLVIGAAGWETKFVVAALEERGWGVDAQISVSPGSTVRQGWLAAIDTTRYSAVLVLDTTAAPFADRIARYVRSGGGLVLWSPAAAVRGLAALSPGRPGQRIDDEGRAPRASAPRDDLALVPIVSLADDAVVLERKGDAVALAARRVGNGRVLQTGYVDSWRWRMAGEDDDAPEQHRAWLAGLVARVAYTGRTELRPPSTEPAPLASLIHRLGPAASGEPGDRPSANPAALFPWIFGALMAALLIEWASRRTRGVR